MRKIISILLLLALLLSLAACHGSAEPKVFEIPTQFDTSRNYEISFWAKNDTNVTQVDIYKQAIADFQALYPNITVNLRLYTDYGKIYNDVITNIATDTTPNVCITYPDHIATYLTGADTVVPLDDLFADPRYGLGGSDVRFDAPRLTEIIPQFLAECEFSGHYYAIPYMRSTEACYVNKTFVEKLGFTLPEKLTWDFVWEVSEAATAKDAEGNFLVNGQKVMLPFIYKSTDNMMIQMLQQLDADYSTAGATWMGSDAPLIDIAEDRLVQFETVVMPIPQFDPEHPIMISQGPSMCVFNKEDPQEVLASWLFAQYMLTNEVQIAYSQTEGYAPVTSKAQQSEAYRDYLSREGEDNQLYYDIKIQATRLLMENTGNTFVTPVFNGSASLRNAAGQMIEEVTKSVRRNRTVDETYIEQLYSEMTSLYRLDQISASGGRLTLGKLPAASVFLLSGLAICWIGIGIYVAVDYIKLKKSQK